MGKIYYLMGKSASGKDTVYKRLLKARPELREYIMYTTRPIRDGEIPGVTYNFTDDNGIEEFRRAGKLIESRTYNTVSGPWTYATVDDGQIDPENGDYLVPGGVLESYVKVRDYFGKDRVVPVYLEVEDGERLLRALKREQSQPVPKYKEMCRRFLADSEDFSEENLKKAEIILSYDNSDTDKCVESILKLMDPDR